MTEQGKQSEFWQSRLKLPVIAAPMFLVSNQALVIEACRAGIVGAFPTVNCRTPEELDEWLTAIESALGPQDAPFAVNIIVHHSNKRRDADLEVVCKHKPELVITSIGRPDAVVAPIHDYGGQIYADVASMRHAELAVAAGVDGLILLTAGAGGQTGWANPFAFVRGVREFFDGPVVLAGGVADAQSLMAARVLGCDLAYMGTRFIATQESMADPRHKQMVADARLDDIKLTTASTGLESSLLAESLRAAGLDPDNLPPRGEVPIDRNINPDAPRRWKDVWSAGHTSQQVKDIPKAGDLIRSLIDDYAQLKTGITL